MESSNYKFSRRTVLTVVAGGAALIGGATAILPLNAEPAAATRSTRLLARMSARKSTRPPRRRSTLSATPCRAKTARAALLPPEAAKRARAAPAMKGASFGAATSHLRQQHVTPTKFTPHIIIISCDQKTFLIAGHPPAYRAIVDENERGTPVRQAKSQTSSHGAKQHHRMDGHDLEPGHGLHQDQRGMRQLLCRAILGAVSRSARASVRKRL